MAAPAHLIEEVEVKSFECRQFGSFKLPQPPASAQLNEKDGGSYSASVRDVYPIAKALVAVSNRYGLTFFANAAGALWCCAPSSCELEALIRVCCHFAGGLEWCFTDSLMAPVSEKLRADETNVSIEVEKMPKLLHHVNVAVNSRLPFAPRTQSRASSYLSCLSESRINSGTWPLIVMSRWSPSASSATSTSTKSRRLSQRSRNRSKCLKSMRRN
jgi:hypothetical protein